MLIFKHSITKNSIKCIIRCNITAICIFLIFFIFILTIRKWLCEIKTINSHYIQNVEKNIMNRYFYSNVIYKPIKVRRQLDAPNIAILVIIYNDKNPEEYLLAQNTLNCYATLHNYTLIKLNLEQESDVLRECPGKDFMFQRHCVIAKFMGSNPQIEWVLFLDADMGVVNPNHLIEEYIDPTADLSFYDRLFNYEIAAGSYLAKNTNFTHDFLLKWSQYEQKLKPGSFQALRSDNGAIHEVFLDKFCGDCSVEKRQKCTQIWEDSKNNDDLFMYESCARFILGVRNKFKNENGTIRQLSNPSNYWVRDGWQTDNRWGDDDFLLHGWKESRRDTLSNITPFSRLKKRFLSPLVDDTKFDTERCHDYTKASLNWPYKNTFMRPRKEMRHRLKKIHQDSFVEHFNRAAKLASSD